MFQCALVSSRKLLAWFAFFVVFTFPAPAAADARVSESYGKLPLHFEANQGQAHEDVRFLSRGSGYSLYLTSREAVLVLTRPDPNGRPDGRGTPGRREAPAQAESVALRMSLVGAASKPLVSGLEELPGRANYFIGSDPAKWRTNVPTYAKVHYRGVYPGIDLVYYGNQRQLEYDFVVAPGADPKKIVLGFKGADKVEIDAEGELVLHVPGGAVHQKKPVIYQEIDGVRQEVAGSYVRKGAKRVGFKVAAYDKSRPLVIDPVVLSYSTYLGGAYYDRGRAIAVDAAGNAYVTGFTDERHFPTTPGAYPSIFLAGSNAFVTKFNPSGSILVYSAIIGGGGDDIGHGIAVDTDGNAYVTGVTNSASFPTTPGAFQIMFGGGVDEQGGGDAFVAKLNDTGSVLLYSTYLGGSRNEVGSGLAVDSDGNAYLTGTTNSTDFPTTPGAFQATWTGAFVTKLNPAGTALVYSTAHVGGNAIAVDADGNAYVAGSAGTGFQTTAGAFQPTFGGGFRDASVIKLNPTGSALVYSTYLGGTGDEHASGIAVDASGNAYVTGYTSSFDFPTTVGAFQTAFAGGSGGDPRFGASFPPTDAFVTKLDPNGSALVYSTYLGAAGDDFGWGIAVDTLGNAYLIGDTRSVNFPTTPGAPQSAFGGGIHDAYVTKLDPAGSALVYSTYLGGGGDDLGNAIAVDASRNAYVTGYTDSTDFPTTTGALQPTFGGGSDAFVAKIVDDTPPPSTPTRSEESAAAYTGPWSSYGAESGTFSGGSIVATNNVGATATFAFTGTAITWIGVRCEICGIATVSIDGGVPTVVNTAGPPRPPDSLVSEPVYSANDLAPGVTHTMVITVTGTTATSVPGLVAGHAQIAVDAFDVAQ